MVWEVGEAKTWESYASRVRYDFRVIPPHLFSLNSLPRLAGLAPRADRGVMQSHREARVARGAPGGRVYFLRRVRLVVVHVRVCTKLKDTPARASHSYRKGRNRPGAAPQAGQAGKTRLLGLRTQSFTQACYTLTISKTHSSA